MLDCATVSGAWQESSGKGRLECRIGIARLTAGERGELAREAIHRKLDQELSEVDFGSAEIYLLHGYPQSDIGKGNLIARLASMFRPDSNIVKFDGFLNTNKDGRYPSRHSYDFPIYRRFLPYVEFGGCNQIISGMLLAEFLERFGETGDHLLFRPHVSKFFLLTLYRCWKGLGRPERLFVEIGGTFLDPEVSLFVLPALSLLKRIHKGVSSFLLTELHYSGQHLKSRTLQRALSEGLRYDLVFDVVFARKPFDLPACKRDHALTEYIASRVSGSLIYGGRVPKLVLVPFFSDPAMPTYRRFLLRHKAEIFGEPDRA